jgi:hypothetical protein
MSAEVGVEVVVVSTALVTEPPSAELVPPEPPALDAPVAVAPVALCEPSDPDVAEMPLVPLEEVPSADVAESPPAVADDVTVVPPSACVPSEVEALLETPTPPSLEAATTEPDAVPEDDAGPTAETSPVAPPEPLPVTAPRLCVEMSSAAST